MGRGREAGMSDLRARGEWSCLEKVSGGKRCIQCRCRLKGVAGVTSKHVW